MARRLVRCVLTAVLVTLCACTGSSPQQSRTPTGSPSPTPAFFPDGTGLPAGCAATDPTDTQTVVFSALGRVWALDPSSGQLSCLLEAPDPGPFLLGPQGNRLLLNGFQIAGWNSSPSFPATGLDPAAVGWSRPQGTAIIYVKTGDVRPEMFFLETGATKTLSALPQATYLEFSYHPTGLAIGYILERGGKQSIWFSMNTGTKAKRLVFSEIGTTFSDLTFSRDGNFMFYMAHHAKGYSELHFIDLRFPRTLHSIWKGPNGDYVRVFEPSPNGRRYAVTNGLGCSQSRAGVLVGNKQERTLIPDAAEPTASLGWLNAGTILVAKGGCGATLDLYAVQANGVSAPQLLVKGVSAGALRSTRPSPPTSLPKEVRLVGGSGVG